MIGDILLMAAGLVLALGAATVAAFLATFLLMAITEILAWVTRNGR